MGKKKRLTQEQRVLKYREELQWKHRSGLMKKVCPRERCMITEKAKFKTELDAQTYALLHNFPQHSYRCPYCSLYHLATNL